MRYVCPVSLALCVLSLSFSVSAESAPRPVEKLSQEQLEAIAIRPATSWGQTNGIYNVVPEMLDLFREDFIEFEGKTMRYRLHVPENIQPGEKYPLLLWLHGAGEVGIDNKLQLFHLHHILPLLIGERKRDFFLLVPQEPPMGPSWGTPEFWTNSFMTHQPIPEKVQNGTQTLEEYKEELMEEMKEVYGKQGIGVQGDVNITIEESDPITITETRTRRIGGIFGFGGRNIVEEIEIEHSGGLAVTITFHQTVGGHPLEFAFAMVDQVVENYPVDINRITVSGLSSGGDGAWRALERRPDLFAAAVPLVSWSSLSDQHLEDNPILKKIPIWAIYSSDDRAIDSARAEFERAESAGANVKKTEFGICGHHAWTPAMLQADIFSWLLSRAKDGDRFYAVFDPGVDPDDMQGIIDVATRDTRPGPTLAPVVAAPVVTGDDALSRLQEIQEIVFHVEHKSPLNPALTPEELIQLQQQYADLSMRYFDAARFAHHSNERENERRNLVRFQNTFRKLTPQEQIRLLGPILETRDVSISGHALEVLELLMDELRDGTGQRSGLKIARDATGAASPDSSVSTAISAVRIIEECDRPWAMTSASLYGMFAADWDQEAEAVPDFIVNSTSEQLSHILARSVSEDPESKEFIAACRSILLLQHRPMSSPWFATSGGRLRSDIQYELSQKGQMFVRFLRVVQASQSTDKARELSKIAERTLEKIDLVLAKD